ncbi:MAG: DUF2490 domain-containing protein [Sedimentisphaerales bacterium]
MSKLHKTTIYFVAVFMCAGFPCGPCFAFDDGDFQYWSAVGGSFDINQDWGCSFEEEFRFGDDAGELYYHHSDLGFVYKGFAEWIDLGFNYRQAFERTDSEGEWKQENRPHLNVTLKGQLFGLNVSDRSRFEYRDREDKNDLWRYRNKVTVKFPLELTELKLKPYLADEVFVPLNDDNIARNRVYAGVSFKVLENMTGEVFYLWQSSRSAGDWNDINVLGTWLKFRF